MSSVPLVGTEVLAQFFFNKTEDKAEYQGIITAFITNLLVEERYYYLQHDRDHAHTLAETVFLKKLFNDDSFPHQFGYRKHRDFTLPDAFLWGYLNDQVFSRGSTTIEKLKQCITDKINTIPHAELNHIFQNMLNWLR